MNFLEQLAAEWYQYKGYLVRTNLRFGRNVHGKGGHVGEMDVIAYEPKTRDFIHVEASADADSWPKRKQTFEKKFTDARKHYMEVFPFKEMEIKPRQIALVGSNLSPTPEVISWNSSAPSGSPWGDIRIEVLHIPEFIRLINAEVKNKSPLNDAIPETYPLLRAIQHSVFYNKKRIKPENK